MFIRMIVQKQTCVLLEWLNKDVFIGMTEQRCVYLDDWTNMFIGMIEQSYLLEWLNKYVFIKMIE